MSEVAIQTVPEQGTLAPPAPTPPTTAPATQYIPLSHQDNGWKQTVLYVALGAVVVGGVGYLGYKVYRNFVSGREDAKALDTDGVSLVAKRIKMAFDNDGYWGTDEIALREILRNVKSQEEWVAIGTSYRRHYGEELMAHMEDELTSTELAEMTAIINSKPNEGGATDPTRQYENWAKRINAAVNVSYGWLPGTDENAIKAVFTEIPTQSAFVKVGTEYARLYSENMTDDLKGDLYFLDYAEMMKIILAKPK